MTERGYGDPIGWPPPHTVGASLRLRDGRRRMASSAASRVPRVTSRTAGEPLVRLSGVDKSFGELHVLQDIDLSIDRGEVVVVIGPSGSGKSTLCRTINRLEPIDSGEIAIDGQRLPEEGRELARLDRKSTRLNSSHANISYAV